MSGDNFYLYNLGMKEMITSPANNKIKEYAKLLQKKYRDETGLFIVEGYHLVEEATKANIVKEVLTSDEKVKGTLVSPEVIAKLSSTETPQPIVAVCKKMHRELKGNRVLALDNIQDPGNVGTLIRTARAFSWDSVLVKGVDIYSPKVIRSSQGAFFSMNVIQTQDLTRSFDEYEVIGAILDKGAITYSNYIPNKKIILVLGNEGNGISKEVIAKLDKKVYIPIDFESLNVAQAGAILLNEYKKI